MKRFVLLFSSLAIIGCAGEPFSPGGAGTPLGLPDPPSAAVLLHHLGVLADDSMRGRRAGSAYEEMAADYVRSEFVRYGLQPAVPDYLQEFPIPFSVDGQSGLGSQNVLAVLPGSGGLAQQWVVVGAHYDHLGVSPDNQVYNGADDNASGTALLLEVARYLSEYVSGVTGDRERRSVMFQAYGSEELGLIGSNYFCSHPTVPMATVTAMVNMDMVGMLRENRLILIGTSSSTDWPPVYGEASRARFDLVISDDVLNRSDQYCFYQLRKPVMFVHTGTHPEYHTPADDVATLNIDGMVRVGEFTILALTDLVYRAEPLAPTGVEASALGLDAAVASH